MIVVHQAASTPALSPLFLALLTGCITALGAIFGVWLTQRRTVHLAYQQRSDTRKEAVRRLVGELVDAAREWGTAAEVQAVFMAKAEQKDVIEFVDTDSGVRLRELIAIKKRASLEARMRIAEAGLTQALERAWAQEAVFNEAVAKLYPSAKRPRGEGLTPLIVAVFRASEQYQATLDAIEIEAGALLREPMEIPLPPLLTTRVWRRVTAESRRIYARAKEALSRH